MQPLHNEQNNSEKLCLDYELITLTNTLVNSFEEGLRLAATLMRAPFFIVNRHNHVVIRAELDEIDDSAWNVIASTGFFPHATIVENKNIHSILIPQIGKMVYYSASEPNTRQKKVATYIAWIIAHLSEEQFYTSDFISTPKSRILSHLLNGQFDRITDSSSNSLITALPQRMQILACFCNSHSGNCVAEISKICNSTEYVTVHNWKYQIFLFSHLTPAQTESLSEMLAQHNIYAGLSYPFSSYKECYHHAHQAISALNEATKRSRKNHLAQYENLFALDVLYNFSSNIPLSSYRHPLFLFLEDYDKKNNSELYNTLMIYVESSGSTQETANRLSAHRNTVSYRLRQVREITGYDVQASSCRASLLYAMTIEHALNRPTS